MGNFKEYLDGVLNEEKIIKVNVDDPARTIYDIVVIDSTHIKFRIKGTKKWAIPLHFGQVGDEMMKGLKIVGAVKNNSFKG